MEHHQRQSGTFWPSPLQRRLLSVALDEPERAAAVWRELQANLDFERMEQGTFELMPMISRRLAAAGHEDPLSAKLNGIYRKSWLLLALVLERSSAAAEVLAAAGIEALFIQGPTLALRYYPEPATRYSPYAEILLNDESLDRAVARLARVGLYERPERAPRDAGFRRLFDEHGNSIALRGRLAIDFGDDSRTANALLTENVETFEANGVAMPVPAPTDALIAIVTSGARKVPETDLVWVVDAVMISRSGRVDWEALVARAAATHQAVRLGAALDYIAGLPGSAVPAGARERLACVPVTRRERIGFRCASGSSWVLGELPTIAADYLAMTRDRSPAGTLAGLPGHLRDRWGLEHVWQLPFAVARRAVQRLTARSRESQPSR